MTCVVGMVYKNTVYIGADSCGCNAAQYQKQARKDPKVFKVGEFIIGFTSSFRMGQLLQYSFKPPKQKTNQNIHQYMVTNFIDELRKVLKDGGYARISDSRESGGEFLVGYRGKLFSIDNDFQVGELLEKIDSVGCGDSYALGSMFSTKKSNYTPEQRIKLALEAAEHYSAYVMKPFTILKLENK